MYPACSGLGKLEPHGRGRLKCTQPIPTGHIGVTLLSVLPMYPACAWWVFWSLSPVSGVPQTHRPQRHAPINHNSTRKDITIWNHQKHTHRRDSEDIAFGLLMTQTDILLQMPSNRTLVATWSTPGLRASMPIKNAFRICTFRIWYRPER